MNLYCQPTLLNVLGSVLSKQKQTMACKMINDLYNSIQTFTYLFSFTLFQLTCKFPWIYHTNMQNGGYLNFFPKQGKHITTMEAFSIIPLHKFDSKEYHYWQLKHTSKSSKKIFVKDCVIVICKFLASTVHKTQSTRFHFTQNKLKLFLYWLYSKIIQTTTWESIIHQLSHAIQCKSSVNFLWSEFFT